MAIKMRKSSSASNLRTSSHEKDGIDETPVKHKFVLKQKSLLNQKTGKFGQFAGE